MVINGNGKYIVCQRSPKLPFFIQIISLKLIEVKIYDLDGSALYPIESTKMTPTDLYVFLCFYNLHLGVLTFSAEI